METYRQVLEINPGDTQARQNLELLQKQSRPAPDPLQMGYVFARGSTFSAA